MPAESDGTYLLSRFRESEIYSKTRLYLSYFYNKSPNICINGLSRISLTMFLSSQGLPTDPNELRQIFFKFHTKYENLRPTDIEEDLKGLGLYMSSERTRHLANAKVSKQTNIKITNYKIFT